MAETIIIRLRGGLPACGNGIVQLAPAMDAAEGAMAKLGKYARFLFNDSRVYLPDGEPFAEKWMEAYRSAGIDSRYFHRIPLYHTPLTEYAVSNFRRNVILCGEDIEQERLIRSLWAGVRGSGGGRRVKYQGIVLPGEEFVTDCSVWVEGGISVSVTVCGGWARGIALRIAGVFADAIGMRAENRMSKSIKPRHRSSENGDGGV